MNENTFTLDLNDKVVVDIGRYEALLEKESCINILKEYIYRERFIDAKTIRIILDMPDPPKEDVK